MPFHAINVMSRRAAVVLFALVASGAPAAAADGVAGPYLAAEHAARRGDVAAAAIYYVEALARNPNDLGLIEDAVTFQVAAGRIESAISLASKLEGRDGAQHLATLLLFSSALKKGDTERARILQRGLSDGPFVGRLLAAWLEVAAGNIGTARDLLAQLEEDGTGGPAGSLMAAYHLGLLMAVEGDDAAAADAFGRASERAGTGTLRLTRMHAGALARAGKLEEAKAVVADRLALTLGDVRLERLSQDLSRGRLPAPVVASGTEGAAEALFGVSGFLTRGTNRIIGLAYARLAAHLNPDLIEAKLFIAETLSRDAQNELAIAAYEAIPRDVPEALEAQIGRARAMQDAGRIEGALVSMRDIVARYPLSVEAHTSLGDMLRRESRFAEAAVAYDGALGLIDAPERRHWPLFYQRGIAFERSKKWEQAEADFFRALELEPDQPLVLNYLGYSWVEMSLNLEEAQRMIEKAVEQRPEDGYIVDSLGWVLYRLGDFRGAVKHLERAVELRPVDPVINDHFGDALWMVGRKVEAEFQWKRALSFEPEDKDAVRIRRKLELGLDEVLAEEAAAGDPAVIGKTEAPAEGDGG
ncbi:MAG: tetratricopeptide repeat protein [Pseudomonadota bacterium]